MGGGVNGSLSHFQRSILVKVFSRSDATRLDRFQSYDALNWRYLSISMVIRAVHSCISTAFCDVPTKLLMCSSCYTCLKKISTSHLDL